MNTTEFIEKALTWQKLMAQAKAIEKELETPFRELFADKKQTIGRFSVKLNKGRAVMDYQKTWERENGRILPPPQYLKTTYDYTAAVKDAGIENVIVKTEPTERVEFTYLGDEND